jgi:hypothetical protein
LERGASCLVLGNEDQAGGVLVETVDDPGSVRSADVRYLGAVGQHRVDQGAAGVTGPRMHDHPCRLVDHQQDVVLVNDVKGNVFR